VGGWRDTYNLERPHEALGMDVPASRYEVSERSFPEELPPVEYGQSDEEVRKVHSTGYVSFQSQRFKVGKAFGGHPVALRSTVESGKSTFAISMFALSNSTNPLADLYTMSPNRCIPSLRSAHERAG
jgi:hypothetical protein